MANKPHPGNLNVALLWLISQWLFLCQLVVAGGNLNAAFLPIELAVAIAYQPDGYQALPWHWQSQCGYSFAIRVSMTIPLWLSFQLR